MGVTPASQRSELDATQPITRKYVVLSEDDRIAIRRHHALNPKARKIQTARKYNVYRETIASILKNQKKKVRKTRTQLLTEDRQAIYGFHQSNPTVSRKEIAKKYDISMTSVGRVISRKDGLDTMD
ncbi:hypothetical protein FRB94_009845 [Tulasnella sp. JGI-2019a]|nr:hypothetical protein FRB93_013769 [Tulasnella sp. JGI-2019a]KAG9010764.1 hypothetical protein FRB94_009845 [Tulasnella sp. JGI-2019a]